jgi:hypothetical protein
MHWLRQVSCNFKLLPLEVVHCVVIQASEGHVMPAGFHLYLHLIKGRAGEDAAAASSKLNNILSAASRVVFKGFNAGFPHLLADALAEAAIHGIPQAFLQVAAALVVQPQAPRRA